MVSYFRLEVCVLTDALVANGEGFIQLNREVTLAERKNSLFNLVTDLIREQHVLLRPYKIKTINQEVSKRVAHLILFKEFSGTPIFSSDSYQLIEKHLTIDKFYADGNSIRGARGFTCAHYTEEYKSLTTSEKIVVHAYFNIQGQYIFSQVKIKQDQYLDVGIELEAAIKCNSQQAFKMLSELLLEKSNRYIHAVSEAALHQAELERLGSSANYTKEIRERYFKAGNMFLNLIKQINLLNDAEVDMRGRFVKEMLGTLTSEEDMPSTSTGAAAATELSLEEVAATGSATVKPKTKKVLKTIKQMQDEQAKFLTRVMALEVELEKFFPLGAGELKKILDAHETAALLNKALTNFVFFDTTSKKPVKQKIVQRINQKISSLPKPLELLERFALEGSVANFMLLFEKAGANISVAFCSQFIRDVVMNTEDQSRLQNQISICDFLFEHSQIYRSAIFLCGYSVDLAESGNGQSLLTKASLLLNFTAFSMLLKHGWNPNGPGAIFGKGVLSNVRVQAILSDSGTFLECLLEHGSHVDNNQFLDTNSASLRALPAAIRSMALQSLPALRQRHAAITNPFLLDYNIPWDIAVAAKNGNYAALVQLVETSSLPGIALALSFFANKTGIIIRTLCNHSVSGLFFAKNASLLERQTRFILELTGTTNNDQIVFIISPKKDGQAIFESIDGSFKKFRKECIENHKKIDDAIKELETAATKEKDSYNKVSLYMACSFLVAGKGKLSAFETQQFIRFHYMIGLEMIKMGNLPQGENYFGKVIRVSEGSKHFAKLKTTPTFTMACNKLKGTSFEYKEPLPIRAAGTVEPEVAPDDVLLPYFQLKRSYSEFIVRESGNSVVQPSTLKRSSSFFT